MKNRKVKMGVVLLLALVTTTGCGDKAIALTEAEESTIVNYAAHVVAKYNTKQPDGLAGLSNDSINEITGTDGTTQGEQENPTDDRMDETNAESMPGESDIGMTQEENKELPDSADAAQVTLSGALGILGVDASVTGVELKDSYVESDYFAVDAVAGKTYLVVNIALTNMTDQDITCDMLSQKPQFKAHVNGGSGVPAETTILLNDTSTYQGVIPALGSAETVLLFMVPKDQVTQVDSLSLDVTVNGVVNEVICQ